MTVSCASPLCKYRLTYGCACQKPKCKVNSPSFAQNGIGCKQHTPRYPKQ
jgi:hypothetical protein